MLKRLFRLAAGIVLVLATLAPLAECFDRWDDRSTAPSNDTELSLVVVATGVGVLMTLTQLIQRWCEHSAPMPFQLRYPDLTALFDRKVCTRLEPTVSPPQLPLRI